MGKGKSSSKALAALASARLSVLSQWFRTRTCLTIPLLCCLLLIAASLLRRLGEASWDMARGPATAHQGPLPLWVWWDYSDKTPEQMPGVIEACRRALQQRTNRSAFKLRMVTHQNVWQELPDLPAAFDSLPKHVPTMLADVVGPGLIARHGGIFVHSDVLLAGNLTWIADLLRAPRDHGGEFADFIGHAEKGQDCRQGELGSALLAGRRGNAFAQEWYDAATKLLTESCEVITTTSTTTTRHNGTGVLRVVGKYVPQAYCKNVSSTSFGQTLFKPILKKQLLRPRPDGTSFRLACLSEDSHHRGIEACVGDCLEYLSDHSDPSKWLDKKKTVKQLPEALFQRFAHHLDMTTLKGGLASLHFETLIRSRSLLAEMIRRTLRIEPVSRFGGLVSYCYSQFYAPAFQEHPYKPVQLVHIPRTGGTSMEMCSRNELDNDERWGRENTLLQSLPEAGSGAGQIPCVGQHVPPSLTNFYDGKETFCVIRHPYERLISIFGFQQGTFHNNEHCDRDTMNKDIVEYLERYAGNEDKEPEPYMFDCHMLPQSAYVYGWDAEQRQVKPEVRSCTHPLTYGKQKSEKELGKVFDDFMAARGYPYRLSDLQRKKGRPHQQVSHHNCRSLIPDQLWDSTKQKIQEIYADDFRLLGFEP